MLGASIIAGISGALPELWLFYVNAIAHIHLPVGTIMLGFAINTFAVCLMFGGLLFTLVWPFSRKWQEGVLARLVAMPTIAMFAFLVFVFSRIRHTMPANLGPWHESEHYLIVYWVLCGPLLVPGAVMGGAYWWFTRGIKA